MTPARSRSRGVPFFERRFVLITGKGGVGRSTLCAAIALEAARRNKRVLVCELNTRERIPPFFDAPPSGSRISQVHNGIWSVNIRPADAMREYGMMKLKIRMLYRAAFENRVIKAFLELIPGLPELLMLGKAFYHEEERHPSTGKRVWDMIVVDAPATGHGVPLMRIPQVVLSVTKSGPMADDARRMHDLLTDPSRTSLNIVTLPEAMPVSEAIDLKQQVDNLLHIPTGFLFLNAVHGPLFRPPARAAFQLLQANWEGDDPLRAELLETGANRIRRHRLEESHLDRLRAEVDMPRVRIPFLYRPQWDRGAVEAVARSLVEGIESHERAD